MSVTAELQSRFGELRDVVRFEEGTGGMGRVVVKTAGEGTGGVGAAGSVFLHGAHVTQWRPAGEEPVLFLSGKSLFDPAKAIRGGVPLIFPWFGAKEGHGDWPMHGFARTGEWEVEDVAVRRGEAAIRFSMQDSQATRKYLGQSFQAAYTVTFGKELGLELVVENRGPGVMVFEEALHTYFLVGDARRISIGGLEGEEYIDKTDGFRRKREQEAVIRIVGETDRVYQNTTGACVIDDAVLGRKIVVEKEGSRSTVVWNPWIEKAKAMADFGDEEWMRMVCVETANVGENGIALAEGERHRMWVRIRVARG